MANNPVTRNVFRYKGGGAVQVYPNLPTMINDFKDGSDVPATIEAPGGHTFAANRNVEFLDDRYVNTAVSGVSGIFKRNQGGDGLWGRIGPGITSTAVSSIITGLHVLHPNGVPTMFYVTPHQFGSLTFAIRSENGTSTTDTNIEGVAVATQMGQSIVYRQSVFWAHNEYAGSAGTGAISAYDLVTSTLTRYDVSAILFSSNLAASYAFHVHGNVMFLFGWNQGVNNYGTVLKLSAGVFVAVYTDTSQYPGAAIGSSTGHSAIFTDPATGDLIVLMSGSNQVGDVPRSKAVSIADAAGAATPTDISTTVMGAVEGADKYLTGGGSANEDRRWSVFVDTQTDPANPRTFLTTWIPGGNTETWEWIGRIGPNRPTLAFVEMEAVASLAGISDDFALPYETAGGGDRSPSTSRVSVFDHAEILGGTKLSFRARGVDTAKTLTFRGTDTEGSPDTIIPIVGSLSWGAGMLPGLIAYYHFDNTFTDFSGNGLDLSAASGTPAYVAGKIGNGVDFTGAGATRLRVLGGNQALKLGLAGIPFTVSVWVDHDTLNNAPICNYSNDSGVDGWSLRVLSNGTVRWLRGTSVLLDSSAGAITVGGFQHIFVVSGGTVAAGGTGVFEIFVDNVSVGSGTPLDTINSGVSFHVGNDNPATLPMDGIIDELAFYDRALTATERGWIYNSGAGFLLEGDTPFSSPPSISGNTIINLLPDEGRTPFSVTLTLDAPGVDIDEGDVMLIIGELT